MSIESSVFFFVMLSGFMTVWLYRFLSKSTDKLGEFEYIGLSAFWGLVILALGSIYLRVYTGGDMEEVQRYFDNPLVIGFNFSVIFSPILAVIGFCIRKPLAKIVRRIFRV